MPAETDPHARFRATRYFGSLDGLRALSIVGVVFHHTAGPAFPGTPLAFGGAMGVSLFFAISGFLITTLLLRERERHGGISLPDFYVRRSLRIFPLYYTVLLVYLALVLFVERDTAARDGFLANLPYFATYTSNWFVDLFDGRVVFYFAWSLATEEQFYLFWPSAEKWLGRHSPFAMLGLLVGVEIVRAGFTPLMEGTTAFSIVTSIAPAICMGVLLAHLLHRRRTFGFIYPALGHPLAAPVLLIAMVVAIGLRWPALIAFALMALVVGAVTIREDHPLAKLLALRPAREIGMVSYGMYLLHMLAHNAVKKVLFALSAHHPLLDFLLSSMLVFGLAWLSYRYYESRFLKLKARFSR